MYPDLRKFVEMALQACGRDRVLHNDRKPFMMAIRWGDFKVPPETKWSVGEGETHSDAGAAVAKQFSETIRKHGKGLVQWADSIDKYLREDAKEVASKKEE